MSPTFTVIASLIFLALSACVVVLNWACVVASFRFHRKGIERHVSTVPLLAQIFALVAAAFSLRATSAHIPGWLFWLVALSDAALLQILYVPVFLLRRKFRAQI